MIKRIFLIVASVFIASCATKALNEYEKNAPKLDVRVFFNGPLKAYGIVKNRQGRVIRYFKAEINASWRGDVGILNEIFQFDDGEEQVRVWRLQKMDNGQFLAEANDVIGKHRMTISGNALFMKYVLSIPYKNTTLAVSVDDKMFLVDERRIINESVMRKWGFRVASVQLVIEK